MKDLILLGAGGHAKSCIDAVEAGGVYHIVGLIDAPEKLDQMRMRSASFQGEGFAARFTRLLEQTACPPAPEQPGAPRG